MRERPDAQALLQQARRDLLELLLPALPSGLRYEALMLANALGVAAREVAAGSGAWRAFESRLHEVMDAPGEASGAALTRQLAAEIRAGDWDADRRLHETLSALTRARLGVANPKVLATAASDEGP